MVAEFRVNATRIFLTYSQVGPNFTKESVYYGLGETFDIKTYMIGEETHEDGGRHIHACIEFRRKIDVRRADAFDLSDEENNYHPNIQVIQRGKANWNRVEKYCEKEDPCPLTNIESKLEWDEMLNTATDPENFLALVRKNYPRDFALNYQRLEAMAKKVYPTQETHTIEEFLLPAGAVIDPILETVELVQWKPLVLVGRPGCGKTLKAKVLAPKPCLFIRHLDRLTLFRPDKHRSIILDDMAFSHLPVATQKYLVDERDVADIHIRYGVATIPAGIPRIFTANEYPFTEEGVHGDAITRRVTRIQLF